MITTLYDFQKKVIQKAIQHPKYYLAIAPGLGKTIMAICIARLKKFNKILIVCQKSKIYDWENEFKGFWDIPITIIKGRKAKRLKTINEFKEGVLIVNYEVSWRDEILLEILDSSWMLIVDESQNLKACPPTKRKKPQLAGSKIGTWGVKASRKVSNVLLLSGTPINETKDLFVQLSMLGMKHDWHFWEDNFLKLRKIKPTNARWYIYLIYGYYHEDVIFDNFHKVSYKLKLEDAFDLPKQNFISTKVHLESKQKKAYRDLKVDKVYKEFFIKSTGELFTRLRQAANGFIDSYTEFSTHKQDWLHDFLSSGEQNVVIFYNFNQELYYMKDICKKLDIKVFENNGHLKNEHLSHDYKGRYIIAVNYGSGAEGLNLQHLNYAIYYSPPLSFIRFKQSIARIHRIGQTKPCFYYFLYTVGTIEKDIYNNLKTGKDYNEKIFRHSLENVL